LIRPTTWPAGRAAVLLDYVLRPAGFIGHCNVRSSLNVAGEFRTSKKSCLRFGQPLANVAMAASRLRLAHRNRDETRFFDPRNRAETELSYG